MLSQMEEYKFDLYGYMIIRDALSADYLQAANRWIDDLPPLEPGQLFGNIVVHSYGGIDGTNLQDIIEGGELFEQLIDHPAWIEQVRHFIGTRHRPYVHEAFLNIREAGGYIGVHSGGHVTDSRKRKGRDRGHWCCSYLSLLVALTDVGPGDGGTVVVPGSHNSDFPHPQQDSRAGISEGPGESLEGAVEVYLNAGDALLINDFLCHGSAERTNAGERRMVIFRYVPEIYGHRFGYVPSAELMARLTPAQREIVQPITPRKWQTDYAA